MEATRRVCYFRRGYVQCLRDPVLASNLPYPSVVCRKLNVPRSGTSCAVSVVRYRRLDSARVHLELVDTRKRLLKGLAEEREAHAISAATPGDAATRDHWQTVRSEVERG